MKNTKRNLAILAIILLLCLFLSCLLFAFIDKTESLIYLKTAIAASLFFPVMGYVTLLLMKMNKNDDTFDEDEDE